jgi:hypothetical protein
MNQPHATCCGFNPPKSGSNQRERFLAIIGTYIKNMLVPAMAKK